MKSLYLIGGTMGVGKTVVCQKLKTMLPNSVFLDGDWCWDAHPFCVTEETKAMVLDNICHVLNNFLHCTAYENVIFCWVMHEQSILNEILSRLDAEPCIVKNISLTCDAPTLKERLFKGIHAGIRTADVVERSLARQSLYDVLDTTKIDTTGKSADAVAEEILNL